jgi:hypothetical protein
MRAGSLAFGKDSGLSTSRRRFISLGASAGAAALLGAAPALAQSPAPSPSPSTCTPFGCTLPAPGEGTPWVRPANTVLAARRSAWELTPHEIERLRLAYKRMRELPASDGRSLQGQRNLHAFYCVTCPPPAPGYPGGDIHGSWNFLPWHRMFLYFHERILGGLIGDYSLRLPYWDWDTWEHAVVPPAYAQPGGTNPLFDTFRYLKAGQSVEQVLTNFNTGDHRYYQLSLVHRLLDCDANQFFGVSASAAGQLPAGGVVESGSHGFVHVSSGGDATRYVKLPCSGDMAILNTAANDPIFYTHHGNLDRLWWSWQTFGDNHDPADPAWQSLAWAFFDEHGKWTKMTVRQMADMQHALGVRYETKIAPPALMSAALGASKPHRIDLLGSGRGPLLAAASADAGLLARSRYGELSLAGVPVPGEDDYTLYVRSPRHGAHRLGDLFITRHGGGRTKMAMNFNVCQPLWGDCISPAPVQPQGCTVGIKADPQVVAALLDPGKMFHLQSSATAAPRALAAAPEAALGARFQPKAAELVVR